MIDNRDGTGCLMFGLLDLRGYTNKLLPGPSHIQRGSGVLFREWIYRFCRPSWPIQASVNSLVKKSKGRCLLFLKTSFRMFLYMIIQQVFSTIGVFVYPIRVNTCAMQACVRLWLVSHLVTVLRACCKWRTCVHFWLAVQVWARQMGDFWLEVCWPVRLSLCHPAGAKC